MSQLVQVSLTAPAAGDYADNDVVSESTTAGTALTIPWAGISGGSATLKGGCINWSAQGIVATFRLWLLNAAPHADTVIEDNVAFSLAIEDRDKVVGFIDFDASVDAGEFSLGQVAAASLNRSFPTKRGDSDLYGILQITDAETGEAAGMTGHISLLVEHD